MNLHEEIAAADALNAAYKARIAELEARLEIQAGVPYDGIACRDVTIKELDAINDSNKRQIETLRLTIGDLCKEIGELRRGATPSTTAVKYGPDNPPRLRIPGESVGEYRAAMGWTNAPQDEDRTAFEKLARAKGYNLTKTPEGEYAFPAASGAWWGYQAAINRSLA